MEYNQPYDHWSLYNFNGIASKRATGRISNESISKAISLFRSLIDRCDEGKKKGNTGEFDEYSVRIQMFHFFIDWNLRSLIIQFRLKILKTGDFFVVDSEFIGKPKKNFR